MLEPDDFKRDGLYATRIAFYLLWLEYLLVSPSYAMAHRWRAGQFSDDDAKHKPADFDEVLAVYDDLGDVSTIAFIDWWRERALPVFGYEGQRPRLRRIDILLPQRHKRAAHRVQEFVKSDWKQQGLPNAALVSVPLGLPKTKILRQMNRLIEKQKSEWKQLSPPRAKYPLLGQRLRKDALFRYLAVVWMRSEMRDQPLWRVGARAKISNKPGLDLDHMARMPPGKNVDERNVMASLTSRAFRRGIALAENAARGKFPINAFPQHAIMPDKSELKAINDRVTKRRIAQKKQL